MSPSMKVVCDRAVLLDALTMAAGVVVSRTPTPVLLCVKLAARDGSLVVASTDLEIGLQLGVHQVDIEEDGEALVPADKLLQIVRALDDPTVTLETDRHTTVIRGARSRFNVFGYDPGEFPEVRDFSGATVDCEVQAGRLRTLISRTLFATAVENSRYAINGVLFERNARQLRLVATDGRRLAVARGDVANGDGDSSCIIPTKALTILGKLIDDPDAPVQVAIEENQALFAVGEGEDAAILSTNLVQGAFPPFEDVIPKDQNKRATFDLASLSSAVRRAALLTNEESKGVKLSIADNTLTLQSRAPEMGEAEINVDVESYSGDPIEIGFNPQYITDALKVIDGMQVMVELNAPNKPGVLRAGNDFTYVVMPVNL